MTFLKVLTYDFDNWGKCRLPPAITFLEKSNLDGVTNWEPVIKV